MRVHPQPQVAPVTGADGRRAGLTAWTRQRLRELLPAAPELAALEAVSGDASHRRYFRALPLAGVSYIAVDAPPDKEDSRAFVEVCQLFGEAGLRAPRLFAADLDQGHLLLEDLGDQLYLPHLLRSRDAGDTAAADRLIHAAIDSLLDLQQRVDASRLPDYDETELMAEMSLFSDWFCRRWLGVAPNARQRAIIGECFRFLCDSALSQARVAVHRDYHSRNLILPAAQPGRPGIIDFQDAVRGPGSYDLVSLLRDCYIRWDRCRLDGWIGHYLEGARSRGIGDGVSAARFRRDFDLMGLQRHLKVLGIFCRLAVRDRKPGFLQHLPLVMDYFVEVAGEYAEMAPLLAWFRRDLEPLAREKIERGR